MGTFEPKSGKQVGNIGDLKPNYNIFNMMLDRQTAELTLEREVKDDTDQAN